jgi:hypothetical protein
MAACAKLSGVAAQWLLGQKKLGVTFADFLDFAGTPAAAGPPAVAAVPPRDGIRPAFIKRFGERITALAAVDAVSNLDQLATEDVDQFFDRCSLAVDKAHYTYTAAQKETPEYKAQFRAFVFIWFSKGLRDEIRTRVMASATPPTEMGPMLEAARKVESELKRAAEKAKTDTASLSAIHVGNPSDQQKRIEELTRELNKLKTGGPRKFQGKCFSCGRWGHARKDCRSGNTRGGWQAPRGRGGYQGNRGGYSNYRQGGGNRGGYGGGRGGSRNFGGSNNNGYRSGQQGGGNRRYYNMEREEGQQDEHAYVEDYQGDSGNY